jgi:hypothetical protein
MHQYHQYHLTQLRAGQVIDQNITESGHWHTESDRRLTEDRPFHGACVVQVSAAEPSV